MVLSKRKSDSNLKRMLTETAALKIKSDDLPLQLDATAQTEITAAHQKITVRRMERSAIAARRRAGSAAISSKRMSDLLNIILCGVKWPNVES